MKNFETVFRFVKSAPTYLSSSTVKLIFLAKVFFLARSSRFFVLFEMSDSGLVAITRPDANDHPMGEAL